MKTREEVRARLEIAFVQLEGCNGAEARQRAALGEERQVQDETLIAQTRVDELEWVLGRARGA